MSEQAFSSAEDQLVLYAYECNGQRIPRNDFYAIACDPRRSVAVEACAGAGKTWMLVSRILRALLEDGASGQGVRPHEILAITFTKKAAGEMRQRLTDWLAEFARSSPEKLQQELQQRGVSAAQATLLAPRLKGLYASMLASGRPVQIRTFHSWFAALLRTAPLAVLQELGLPAHYELLEDDTEAVGRVWRRFQATVAADAALRADYLAVVASFGRHQTGKALAAALSKRVEFALADAQGVVDVSVQHFQQQFPELAAWGEPAQLLTQDAATRQALLAAARALGQAKAVTYSAKGVELEQAVTAGDAPGVEAALLTLKGEPRKFGDKIVGIEQVRQAQAQVLRVVEAQQQHEAWLYQQRMARLTRVLLAEYADLKREHGWVDMNDVESAARVMLADSVLSGWVQERLDARVAHLLIDEFQDTNPLQWQALYAWLGSYAGAGGGGGSASGGAPSVFIVGDPKQSIYRFRRAEPQVFRAAQAFVRDGLGGSLLSCDHTRRNARGVIATVNQVMLAAQAEGAYEGFRPHTTESAEPGELLELPQIPRPSRGDKADTEDDDQGEGPALWRDSLTTPREVPEETLRTLECRQAAQWLAQQVAQGLAPQQVLVLSRKRERLEVMRQELQALHLPAQMPAKDDLSEAPEVQDVVALLDVLVSPGHNLSLARALKSPVFGLDDAALMQLALAQRAQGGSWWDALQSDLLQKEELLAPGGRALPAVLMQWKSWVDSLPPHDALDSIFHDGDVLARYGAASPPTLRGSVLANLRAVLGAALQMDGARYLTPYALVRALRAGGVRAPAQADANAMRLLTVHGAKGLEARLVLMLDTDAEPTKPETMGVLVDWPGEAAAPEKFVFLARETHPSPCALPSVQAEQAARQREELNALYVAMTRAKSTLVLSSVQAFRPQEGSWWRRLSPLASSIALATPAVAMPQAGGPAPESPSFQMPFLPETPVHQAQEAIKMVANEAPQDAPDSLESRLGQAMHRLLEWTPPGAPEFTAAQLEAVARAFELTPAQAAQAAQLARRILGGQGAWAWQAERLVWQGNEVALVHQGQMLRLDRLVRLRAEDGSPGAWWVLDYKMSGQPRQQPGLVAQLQRYGQALRSSNPGDEVHTAWLTGDGQLVQAD